MKYSVFSLFPHLVEAYFADALLQKALQKQLIALELYNLRDYSNNKHHTVDDSPYGGGAGMVMRVDVVARALADMKESADEVVLLSPAGEPFRQAEAERLAGLGHVALLCGRYEGFDARVEQLVSKELSIGDYVLMGGELAALSIIEASARLIPGVLGAADSHLQDSHSTGLLDYPEYTRPAEFQGMGVPEVLLSGHHGKIAQWRHEQALQRTKERRPDIYQRYLDTP